MTGSKLLIRNTAFNLAGQGVPLIAALVAIPWLIHGLGADRFGVLTLAWAAIGYFSLVDLGLGRALTHAVATRLGSDREDELVSIGWTALPAPSSLIAKQDFRKSLVADTWILPRTINKK